MRTRSSTLHSLIPWRKRLIWSTGNILGKQFRKTAGEATCLGSIQEEAVKCMIRSSSTQDPTIRLFRKFCSVTKLWKIMESWPSSRPVDLKSNWIMIWNCQLQLMNSTKRSVKRGIRARSKISRRVEQDRFNLLQIRKETNRWGSKVRIRIRESRRLHSRTAVFKQVIITRAKADHWLVWSTQPTRAPTKSKEVNLTRARFTTKKTDQLWKTSPPRNLKSLRATQAASSNNRRKYSSPAMTSSLNTSNVWWTSWN